MTNPRARFSWSESDGRLLMEVTCESRSTVWTIGPRTSVVQVAGMLSEIAAALTDLPIRVPGRALAKLRNPDQSPEAPPAEQMSEEGSAELRAAKAKSVERNGRAWFSNMATEGEDELPLFTIGHGE